MIGRTVPVNPRESKKKKNETVTNCNAFKLRAADGKMRLTDVADTEYTAEPTRCVFDLFYFTP